MLWRWLRNLRSNKAFIILALGDGDWVVACHASDSHTSIISKCGFGARGGAFEIASTVLGRPRLAGVGHTCAAESALGPEVVESAAGVAVYQHSLDLLRWNLVWVVGSP